MHPNVPPGKDVFKKLELIEYLVYLKILREYLSYGGVFGAELMINT